MQTTHAYDSNGEIVGICKTTSLAQIASWEAMGFTTVEGPDVDISLWKYVDGVLTAKTSQEISDAAAALAVKSIPTTLSSQVSIYGQGLTGNETARELAKLKKIQDLSLEMRANLNGQIGDTEAKITDILRMITAGESIRIGLVTDPTAIATYEQFIGGMLQGFGGISEILGVLATDMSAVGTWLIGKFYVAKAAVNAIQDTADEDADIASYNAITL